MSSKTKGAPSFILILAAFLTGILMGCSNNQGISNASSPPEVKSTNPEDNADKISVTTSVNAAFNQPMDEATINESTFILKSDTDTLVGTISASDTTATLALSDSLSYGTRYVASLSSDIKDAAGNALPSTYQWSFITEEQEANMDDDGDDGSGEGEEDNNSEDGQDGDGDNGGDGTGDDSNNAGDDGNGDGEENGDDENGGEEDSDNGNDDNQQDDSRDEDDNGDGGDEQGDSDTTPPSVTNIDPDGNTTGVPIDITISATFNEALDGNTIHSESVILQGPSEDVQGAVNTSGNEVIFSPEGDLENSSEYTFIISTEVTDTAGNQLQEEYSTGFTTEEDNIRPVVLSSDPPQNGSENVSVDTNIEVTFSEEVDPSTVELVLYNPGTERTYQGSIGVSENVLTYSPDSSLSYRSGFELVISRAEDLAGNNLRPEYTMSFSTEQPPVTTPPTVESNSPGDGDSGVSVDTEISVTFSEDIDPYSVNEQTITLEGPNGEVPITARSPDNTITISPVSSLQEGSSYTYTISGVRDVYNNRFEGEFSTTFTTEGNPIAGN